MDGQSASPTRAIPLWISQGRPALPAPVTAVALVDTESRQRAAASLFLHRDFSDVGLQQPAEPSFSTSELEAARSEGYERGHSDGLAEAEASRLACETITLTAIAGAMAGARTAVGFVAEETAAALARAMIAAMHVTMPALIANSAIGEIGAMIACLLPGLAREPEIRVEVAPTIAAGVRTGLDRLGRDDRVRITVLGTDEVAPGAAKITWSTGQAERQPQLLWQQIVDAFDLKLNDVPSTETKHAQ